MVDKTINTDRQINSSSKRSQSDSTMLNNNRSMELNFVRKQLEKCQATILKDVEKRMTNMMDDILQEMRQHELQIKEFRSFANPQNEQRHTNNTWSNRTSTNNNQHDIFETDDADDKINTIEANEANSSAAEQVGNGIKNNNHKPGKTKIRSGRRQQQQRALPDKIFVARESYLTALLQVDHMKTIYHIFYIILLILFMNSICYDYFVDGRINLGLGTFKTGLNKIHYVFAAWLFEHVFVFALYFSYKVWAAVRARLSKQQTLQRFWSHSCLIVYISSQLVFAYIASALCLKLDLPFITASVLLLETTRLLMKMHAFVRTNVPRILAGKVKSDDDLAVSFPVSTIPPFKCYLYFLFAPTLIYRDSYPRTSQIRWKFATARFLEVVAIAFLYSYIHERHIKVHFHAYGREELNESTVIVKVFGMFMPSVIIFLCGFYLILHSWLNFTAELLRFGDRMFYKDWWTSASYDAYYRNWNVVVHDWLYEYVYKDSYNHIFIGSKLAGSLMVFLVSALVHEHILGFALQLFFPIMFVFFGGVGVSLVFITRNVPKPIGNIMVWASLIIGNGLMISLYAMEYYARQNCPKTYENWLDYLTPAVLNCYKS